MPPIKMNGPTEETFARKPVQVIQITNRSINTSLFQDQLPDFYSLLLASCTSKGPSTSRILQLDLRLTTPLMRRAIQMAVQKKICGN